MHWIVLAIGIIAIELMLFGWILYVHGEKLHAIEEELVVLHSRIDKATELHMRIATIAGSFWRDQNEHT